MTARGLNLLVLYTPRLEECRAFYASLGLAFAPGQHGQGPEHFAAVLEDGTVFELYPSRPGRETGSVRLGIEIAGSAARPPLAKGRHQAIDPDGRTVVVQAT